MLKTKNQFKDAMSYMKESKKYIFCAFFIFLLGSFFGFVFSSELSFLDEVLAELIKETQGLNLPEMIFYILQNNLQSALFSIVFGLFLGIFPVFSALANGIVLGYVFEETYKIAGIIPLLKILPHGFFELPAIFISIGIGIKLGFSLFLNKKIRIKEFRRRLYNSANTVLMIVIPLLIAAAIIEGILIFVLK